jgi:hypothetical protein
LKKINYINLSTKKINSAHDITFFENIQNDHYQFNINLPGLLCSNDCNYEKIDESSFKTRYIMVLFDIYFIRKKIRKILFSRINYLMIPITLII